MPQILVRADAAAEGDPPIIYWERVNPEEMRSSHFRDQLAQRIGWAVDDAAEAEEEHGRDAARN